MTLKPLYLILFSFFFVFPFCAHANPYVTEIKEVSIKTQNGDRHNFIVGIANTLPAQARGLMHVRSLPENQGMLFVFKKVEEQSFWMKNTLIPLDILFFDQKKRLVHIAKNAQPESLDPKNSKVPVKYVLEINGGLSKTLDIRPGDRLIP